jgi:cytochrome c oxidase subunit 2
MIRTFLFLALLNLSNVMRAGEIQSALAPASTQADLIKHLWRLFLLVSVVVYAIVIVLLLIPAFRRGNWAKGDDSIQKQDVEREKRLWTIVTSAIVATVCILFFLLVTDFSTARSINSLTDSNPVKIKVIGHQWWWEVHYEDPVTSNMVITANEIHLPVGKSARIELESNDVIHSFWIPNLQGKRDLIPGHRSTIWLHPDKTGEYRGQCAEFCGHQHAHMRFEVQVQNMADYTSWLEQQRNTPAAPQTESARKGQQVFLSHTCVMCHSIGGTPARASVGPSLTHIASRKYLAAGTLKNNRGNLSGWILDPQLIKPGVKMPQNNLAPDDLNELLDYMDTLK